MPLYCPNQQCKKEIDRKDIEENVSSDYFSNNFLITEVSQRLTPAQIKCIIEVR